MTNEDTIGKLMEMHMTAMANALREQLKNPEMTNLCVRQVKMLAKGPQKG